MDISQRASVTPEVTNGELLPAVAVYARQQKQQLLGLLRHLDPTRLCGAEWLVERQRATGTFDAIYGCPK